MLRQQLSAARAEAAALRRALHAAQRCQNPAAGSSVISAAALEQVQARAESMEMDNVRLCMQLVSVILLPLLHERLLLHCLIGDEYSSSR